MPSQQRAQAWTNIRHALLPPVEATSDLVIATDDCPQEFIDPITLNAMQDPVILPSNIRCDRSTIVRHLSRSKKDPFTGLPLDIDQ
ncbi:hypothetical protein GGH95_006552, partial [Coemansia sp. RSA 1836]